MTMSRAGYLFINFFLVRIRIYLLHMLFVCARAHARAKRWRLAVVPKPMCVSLNTRSTILDHEQQQKNRDRKRCMHTLRTHTHTDRWMEFYNEKRSESLVGNSKHLVFFLSRFETFLFSFSKSRTLIWWYCNTCMHDILFTKNQQNIDRKKKRTEYYIQPFVGPLYIIILRVKSSWDEHHSHSHTMTWDEPLNTSLFSVMHTRCFFFSFFLVC